MEGAGVPLEGSLRVLRLSERVPPLRGGKEIHVAELTRHQVAYGDIVHLYYRYGDGTSVGATSATRISLPERLSGALGSCLLAFAVARRRRSLPSVDVIHLHGDFAEVPPLARLSRQLHAPLVMTIHGQMNPRYRRSSRWTLRHIDHVIALGNQVAQDLTARGVPASKVTIMSSGLATDLLDAAATQTVQPGLVVSVGSLDAVKNHEQTIRAVLDQPDESQAKLVLIGEGPDRSRLETLASGSERITFMGQLSRAQAYVHVARAQVFVIGSMATATKGEGVPTALLEAMYLGRHCLVSTEALPRPVVTDETAYETFDPRSDDLASLLADALADPERSEAIGVKAHLAVSGLDWPSVAGRVRQVLASVIEGAR